jgi:hypothetical protein
MHPFPKRLRQGVDWHVVAVAIVASGDCSRHQKRGLVGWDGM